MASNAEHVEEILAAMRSASPQLAGFANRIAAALAPAAAPEAGEWVMVPRAMLEAAVCPMAANGCDGEQYPVGDPRGDYYGEQCQFCYERKQALAAPAQSQAVTEGGYQRAWEHLTANSYDHHTPHMVCIPRDEWKAAEALIATPTAAGEAAAPAPQEGGREACVECRGNCPTPELCEAGRKRALAAHQQRGKCDG